MMGLAALLAYISQWEKVNQAYTVSRLFVFLKAPNTLGMRENLQYKGHEIMAVLGTAILFHQISDICCFFLH